MSNLLLNELLKLKKSKTVKVVICIMMVYSLFIALFPGEGYLYRSGFSAPFLMLICYGSLGFWANAAIVSEQIGGEFKSGTIHNTLSSGMERKKYFIAKVIGLYGITAAIYLASAFFLFLCQNLIFGYDPEGLIFSGYWTKVLVYQLGALFVIFGWVSLSVFFSYLLQTAVASFVAMVAASFVELFLSLKFLYDRDIVIGGPTNTVWVMQRMLLTDTDRILSTDFLITLLPCILLIAASVGGAYYLFQKTDIN